MLASIGVDIGGTNTCVGVVTPDGHVHERTQFRTDEYTDGTAFADRLAEAVREVKAADETSDKDCDWTGLGIGAPNGNYLSGSIEEPTRRSFEKHLIPPFKNKIKIIVSALPMGDAAIMGAAALVAE